MKKLVMAMLFALSVVATNGQTIDVTVQLQNNGTCQDGKLSKFTWKYKGGGYPFATAIIEVISPALGRRYTLLETNVPTGTAYWIPTTLFDRSEDWYLEAMFLDSVGNVYYDTTKLFKIMMLPTAPTKTVTIESPLNTTTIPGSFNEIVGPPQGAHSIDVRFSNTGLSPDDKVLFTLRPIGSITGGFISDPILAINTQFNFWIDGESEGFYSLTMYYMNPYGELGVSDESILYIHRRTNP